MNGLVGRGVQCFTLRQVIAEGATGKVQIVEHNDTRQRYALRRVSKAACIEQRRQAAVVGERDLLEELDHPFILGLRYSFQDTYALYTATDLMEGGSLARQLRHRRRFGEAVVRFWAAELACALNYLHTEHRIAHGGVATRNILVDGMGHVALANVAVGQRAGDADRDGAAAADWWGLGAVMYECLYGRGPFRSGTRSGSSSASSSTTGTGLAARAADDDVVFPVTGNSRITMDCVSAIRGLLHRDPAQRLGSGRRGFERLKRHPFFATFDWSLVEDRGVVPPLVPDSAYVQSDPLEYTELGECIDLRPPPLAPRPELVELEARFADFDHAEYARFKGYIERHGSIDEVQADAIRRAGFSREPRDMAAVAAADVPLEYLCLGGLPVVKPCPRAEEPRRDSLAGLPRTSSVFSLSHASLARPASRAIKHGGRLVRRTTSTALARLAGHARTLRRKPAVVDTATRDAPPLEPVPEQVLEPPVVLCQPPCSVPVDALTWTQMTAAQRGLAQRYCAKMTRENQRLMAALISAQEDEDDADDDAEELLQSTYSLTASSLLPAVREAAGSSSNGSIGPATRPRKSLGGNGSGAARAAATLSVMSGERPASRAAYLFLDPLLISGCRSTPDLDVPACRNRPSTPHLRVDTAGPRPMTRRVHAKSAGSIPRLQPIADGWRKYRPTDPAPPPPPPPPPPVVRMVHARHPLVARQLSSDSGWDLLPEATDRLELSAAAAALMAAPVPTVGG
ncbi:hypothetical protein H4R19_000543 [Coemansia spiralis]|nr:hypothetical protein H4R19_000543 [Coemansia spiralis]